MKKESADKWKALIEAKKQKSANQGNDKRGMESIGGTRPKFKSKKGGGLFDR